MECICVTRLDAQGVVWQLRDESTQTGGSAIFLLPDKGVRVCCERQQW